MNTAEQINPVIDRLGDVVERGNLPPPYDRWGARLLAHLTRPVQVVVTGFEGSGKTALIEMMSGQQVLGHELPVPLVELVYGETEQALIERADGSVTSAAGFLKDCDWPDGAVRARQELPDTRLIQQDFIEIGLFGSPAQKRAGLEMAIARADVLIWCSQEFGEQEQQLWSLVPDHIKDHGLLAITMADRLLMRGTLDKTIERLEPVVAEEFLGLFPVATIQGITARTAGEDTNAELWGSSGGQSLMDLLSKQITQGRSADMDQARVFMERLATRMPQSRPADADIPAPSAPEGAKVEIQPDGRESTVLIEPQGVDTSAVAVLSEAVDLLQKHANRMLDDMGDGEDLDADRILSNCSDAIESVSSLINGAEGENALAEAIQDDVQDGEEMLMLFQLERGEDAALDAVTLLLQIRKELIDKLAV